MSISTLPELPATNYALHGTCAERMILVSIKESKTHPGYYDVNVTANNEMNMFKRPVLNGDIGRELIGKFIEAHAPSAELQWTTVYSPHTEVQQKPEQIYFIADEGGYIKIGFATNPGSRLKNLQTASRQELRLIGVMPGAIADEKALHARFADDHVRGEWFKPSQDLCDYIEGAAA